MLKESCLFQISADKNFQQLVVPLPPHGEIRDAEFYIRCDGIIFNADGYAHPSGRIVGGALYSPDLQGNKQLFGVRYRKTTVFPSTHEPIPYIERSRHFREIDPELDQSYINPLPYTYEHILPFNEFIGYIPARLAVKAALEGRLVEDPGQIIQDLNSLIQLLDINLAEFAVGFTGAPALGCIQNYHDLDIVFNGDLVQNRQLADKMKDLVIQEPERRLHEGGKSWLIRFYNKSGVANGTLMCCFFTYQRLKDAPLRNFTMNVIEKDIKITASVSDAIHALYTPTIVRLHDIQTSIIRGEEVKERLPDNLSLIIYHTGSRGELNYGDKVWAHGIFVEVVTPQLTYPAIAVIEREGVRNETPPWSEYYTRQKYE